jgi:hypothetical protein
MKIYSKIMILLISLMLVSACAAGTIQMPVRYALDDQLESVDRIYKNRIIDWQYIDNQSLVINTSPGEYYLIVLTIPSYELRFREGISITSSGSYIRAKFDKVVVFDEAHFKNYYPIDKIYKYRWL